MLYTKQYFVNWSKIIKIGERCGKSLSKIKPYLWNWNLIIAKKDENRDKIKELSLLFWKFYALDRDCVESWQ